MSDRAGKGWQPEVRYSKVPHPVGGTLRTPVYEHSRNGFDLAGRVAGERITAGAEMGIGEDGKVYVWPKEG